MPTHTRLRAAFIANGNPRDPKLWSGTPSHMLAALERHFEFVLVVEEPWAAWYRPLGRVLKLLSGRRFEYSWSALYSRWAAQRTVRALRKARPDIVFAVSLTDMAYLLSGEFRLIYVTDAVIPDLVEDYAMYRRLPASVKRRAVETEQAAFAAAALLNFPSAWACRSAIERQGADPDKIVEIAWGANITSVQREARSLPAGPSRLLFVGSDWARKGLLVAIEAVRELNRRGTAARLDVVGCAAADLPEQDLSDCTFHGLVDKQSEAGRTLLDELYADATLFLLPTTAEAYGIVFAEAAHHGLPSLSYATGGVPSVVRHGVTGVLLPHGVPPARFADEVGRLLASPDLYRSMSEAALADARGRLSWEIWAERLTSAIHARLNGQAPQRLDAAQPTAG